MRKLLLAGLVAGAAMMAALPAGATPLGGQTISNVVIQGTTYTVTFFDAPFNTIPAAGNVSFSDQAGSYAAIAAIKGTAAYASLTAAPSTFWLGVVVPTSQTFSGNTGPTVFSGAVQTGPTTQVYQAEIFSQQDYTASGYTIATFSAAASTTSVPEPASIAMVAFGLFGVGWARRRFVK